MDGDGADGEGGVGLGGGREVAGRCEMGDAGAKNRQRLDLNYRLHLLIIQGCVERDEEREHEHALWRSISWQSNNNF